METHGEEHSHDIAKREKEAKGQTKEKRRRLMSLYSVFLSHLNSGALHLLG